MNNAGIRAAAVAAVLLALCIGAEAQIRAVQQAVAVKRGTFNWVRVAPEHHATVIEKVRQGTQFGVDGEDKAYYHVLLPDGVTGWLSKSNVRFL